MLGEEDIYATLECKMVLFVTSDIVCTRMLKVEEDSSSNGSLQDRNASILIVYTPHWIRVARYAQPVRARFTFAIISRNAI
ncbi:unnamed protein product [Sphenostylis stenocarpa]|uniref:Uncharacterized protein n=1 Tax=Sphenostylis stenocarpa TaxID=92480 RepID=A0AA86TBV7_9FABA|nr:unnamed protein product [Sphenostylis stenocarpa]